MFRSAPSSPCHFFVDTDHDWNLYPAMPADSYLALGSQDVKHGEAKFEVGVVPAPTADVSKLCEPLLKRIPCDEIAPAVKHRTIDIGRDEQVPAIEYECVTGGRKRSRIVFCVRARAGVFQVYLDAAAHENAFDWWRPRFEQLVRSFKLAA